MDNSVNSNIAYNTEKKYVKISRTIGNKHTFLGIDVDFIGGNEVSLTTPHNINEALEDSCEMLK